MRSISRMSRVRIRVSVSIKIKVLGLGFSYCLIENAPSDLHMFFSFLAVYFPVIL